MTASAFVIEPEVLRARSVGDLLTLDGDEAHHAVAVVRVRVGEAIDLVDGHGRRVHAVVRALPGGDVAELEIVAIEDEPAAAHRLTVVQALPKGEHGELAVDLLTQAGADRIVPWAAEHCVAVWRGEKSARGVAKWQSTALRAAKQCRRARIPVVEPLASTAQVGELIRSAACALVLHEESDMAIARIHMPATGEIVMIVGPEGGISARERAVFAQAGAVEAGLGPHVLRSSLAGAAALITMSALKSAGAWKDG